MSTELLWDFWTQNKVIIIIINIAYSANKCVIKKINDVHHYLGCPYKHKYVKDKWANCWIHHFEKFEVGAGHFFVWMSTKISLMRWMAHTRCTLLVCSVL